MGEFVGGLKLQYLGIFKDENREYKPHTDKKSPFRFDDYHQWVILENLYYVTDDDNLVKIPAEKLTDLASIPKVVRKLISENGPMAKPAVLHDRLYGDSHFEKLKFNPCRGKNISFNYNDFARTLNLLLIASAYHPQDGTDKLDIEGIQKANKWSDGEMSRVVSIVFASCKDPKLKQELQKNMNGFMGENFINRSENVGKDVESALKNVLDSLVIEKNDNAEDKDRAKFPRYVADNIYFDEMRKNGVPPLENRLAYAAVFWGAKDAFDGNDARGQNENTDPHKKNADKGENIGYRPKDLVGKRYDLDVLEKELQHITGDGSLNLPKNTNADGFLKKYCGVLRRVHNSIDTPEKLQSYHIAFLRSFKGDPYEYMRKVSQFEKASNLAGNQETLDRMDQLEAMTYFMKKDPFYDIEKTRQYREILRKKSYPNKDYDLLSTQELKLTSWPGSNHKIAENKNDFFVPKNSNSQNSSNLNKETTDTRDRSWPGNNFRVDQPLYAQNLTQKPKTYGADIVGEGFAKKVVPVNPLAPTAQAASQRASYGDQIVRQGLLAGNRPVNQFAATAQAEPLNFFRGDQITGAGLLGLNRPENLPGQVLADILKSRTETPLPEIGQSIPTAGAEALIPGATGPMISNGFLSGLSLLNLLSAFFLRDEKPTQPIFGFGGLGQRAPATR